MEIFEYRYERLKKCLYKEKYRRVGYTTLAKKATKTCQCRQARIRWQKREYKKCSHIACKTVFSACSFLAIAEQREKYRFSKDVNLK